MSANLDRIKTSKKTGEERFYVSNIPPGKKSPDYTLHDFWEWSVSDIVSNATRGMLAEFIVAKALGIGTDVARDEWEAFDLKTPEGKKIQVKSAAYVQGWKQKKFSVITFSIKASRACEGDAGRLQKTPIHGSDVYVFALLTPQEEPPIDPLNLDQWRFYVWPTAKLIAYTRSKSSITLKSLEHQCGPAVDYFGLAEKVNHALSGANEIPKATELGDNVEFYTVNDVPVALVDDVEPFRYDVNPPEPFRYESVFNEGVQITREEFMKMVKK